MSTKPSTKASITNSNASGTPSGGDRPADGSSDKRGIRSGGGLSVSDATPGKRAASSTAFLTSTAGVLLFTFISCFLWGSAFPCVKVGNVLFGISSADTASQLLFAGVRFTISGIMVIVAMSVIRGCPLVPKRRDWGAIVVLSLFQTILQYGLFYPGVSRASGVVSSIIEGSNAFVTILLATLLFKQEKLTVRKVVGCAVGFSGVVIMALRGGSTDTGSFSLLGEGLVFVSTFMAATSSCLIKYFSIKHDPVLLSAYQFLIGGIVLTILGIALDGRLAPSGPSAIILLTYMGFISAAAYTLWSMLLSVNPTSRISIFGFMNPMFGTILSAVLLSEGSAVEPLRAVVALGLVCVGIVIVNRSPRKAAA